LHFFYKLTYIYNYIRSEYVLIFSSSEVTTAKIEFRNGYSNTLEEVIQPFLISGAAQRIKQPLLKAFRLQTVEAIFNHGY
jgi:hypothetical protein